MTDRADIAAKLDELRAAIEADRPTPYQKALRGVAALWVLMSRPRGTAAILEAHSRAFSATLRALTPPAPRCRCGHVEGEHSQQLAGSPCLECGDCVGWLP